MENIYHFTSRKKWDAIRKSGVLLPMSSPDNVKADNPDFLKDMTLFDKYVVGIPDFITPGWKSCGLIDHLVGKTSGEIVLKVPILDTRGAFVREHACVSPARYLKKCGVDLFDMVSRHQVSESDPRVQEAYKEYLGSTVRLSDYKGDYMAPEVWLPQTTPVDIIYAIKF